jgi:hypothetical protein
VSQEELTTYRVSLIDPNAPVVNGRYRATQSGFGLLTRGYIAFTSSHEHNVNNGHKTPLAEHFERPVSESSAKMTLPLTYNVVRLFKLIHLSAIERAQCQRIGR